MTALTFPSNPQSGDNYSAPNGVLYTYDGVKWIAQTTTTTGTMVVDYVQDSIAPIFTNIVSDNISFSYDETTNVLSASVTAQADTGNVTFDNSTLLTPDGVDTPTQGVLKLAPGSTNQTGFLDNGQFIEIYPTGMYDAPHIHIAAGSGVNGKGDLLLGDDNQHIDINNTGNIYVQTYDTLRNNMSSWQFGTDGIIGGPAMGGISIAGSIVGMNGLNLSANNQTRSTQTVQFTDADGTEKSTYTVNYDTYGAILDILDGGANTVYRTLWIANGQSLTITSATVDNVAHTVTITLSDLATLQAATDYVIDRGYTTPTNVTIENANNYWYFNTTGDTQLPNNGSLYQNNSYTKTNNGSAFSTAPTVIWSGLSTSITSVKMTIQIEGYETGDSSGWHTQVCEAIIADRWYGNAGAIDPQMTVYGVVHTSVAPLATFTVQRNPTSHVIELVATPTGTANGTLYPKVHSVELGSRD